MARRKKKRITITKKWAIVLTLTVVIIGLILLIFNRTILKDPEYRISLHDESIEILIGDEKRLGYTIINATGKDKLTWSTSNSKVAIVDSTGKIKGISFGDVKITVTLANGGTSSLNLRVKSYPVYLRVKADVTKTKDWYNQPINVSIETLNINNVKYCISSEDSCNPNSIYKNKINLKNGIWYLYINGIDRNGKSVDYRETFKIDTISPKCNITRVGKLAEENATIDVVCAKDSSGIVNYEFYRDNKRVYISDNNQIYAKNIYLDGKHKYTVKVFDLAGNSTIYSIDN